MRYVGVVLIALVVAGCGAPRPQTQYEQYSDDCRARGGWVSQHTGWNDFEYECVGQTIGPQLPQVRK